MSLKVLSLMMILGAFAGPAAFATPPAADDVMAQAEARARIEQKTIFLHFGASWCGWCKKLEAYLDRADIKPVFDKYFISVRLDTQEDSKNKGLENPGANVWMTKVGGPDGLPFTAFLDAKGALIVNSKRVSSDGGEGHNISYPSAAAELEWFGHMLRKAAPKMSAADLKILETGLKGPKK